MMHSLVFGGDGKICVSGDWESRYVSKVGKPTRDRAVVGDAGEPAAPPGQIAGHFQVMFAGGLKLRRS
jgi:hypothetical protein